VKSSADLRKELEVAEERERAEIRAKKEAVRPIFEYWVAPAETRITSSYGKLYDPTCLLYEIKRTTANRVAARVAGWTEDDMKEGSATYIYNIVTRRIVCAVGGGTIYINRALDSAEDFADDTAFFHLGMYLAEYPGGGDITYIVEDFKANRKASANGHKVKSVTV
jgi:hypothetical protein